MSNPKKSFDHPCHLKLEYPPLGLRSRLESELHDIHNNILHLHSCRPNALQLKENVGFSLPLHLLLLFVGRGNLAKAVLNWDVSLQRFNLRYVTETKYSFVFVVMTLQIFG